MNRTTIAAILLAACAIPFHIAGASSSSRPQLDGHRTIVLKISDLRSAYLQRAGIVQYDRTNLSPDGLREQLQRHFDVVIGLLLVSTPRSIETALTRLEAADGRAWSPSERSEQRQILLATRYLQLHRLAAYRDRGRFPVNQGQANHAIPIFVDRHDTACAVGHLMRLSNRREDVAQIQANNNLVYVPDAMQSAVTAWALTSGLTWEEAALIQPAYGWPAAYNAADYEPGEMVLENNGLRFENFQLVATNYALVPPDEDWPADICTRFPSVCVMAPVPGGVVPQLQGLGLLAGKGQYGGFVSFPQHTPTGTNWIAIAGSRFTSGEPPLHTLGASAAENRGQMITIRFDVSTNAPDKRINGIAESSYLYQGGFYDPLSFAAPDAIYYLKTTANDGVVSVTSLSIDQATVPIGYYQKLDTEQFSPRAKISVAANVWLRDGVAINTFVLDFNVVTVPEPAAAGGAALSFIAFSLLPCRTRRAT